MACVKQGTVKPSNEWAKHLRKWGKRMFWKAERKAAMRRATNED